MITLHAPAKINLCLEVLARREDGYHAIASVMHTLSLHDTLVLSRDTGHGAAPVRIEVEGFAVPTDERNLVWRALVQVGATQAGSWHVKLIKRIPTEAGLGGGSSDAAAILRYFLSSDTSTLHPEPLSKGEREFSARREARPPEDLTPHPDPLPRGEREFSARREARPPENSPPHPNPLPRGEREFGRLLEIACQLGSDVPFFLNGACAQVMGRGERVMPLPPLPPFYWVLAKPPDIGVSTAWAYAQLHRPLAREEETPRPEATLRLAQALAEGAIHMPEQLAPLLHNDFEAVVLPAYEPLQRLRTRMLLLGALRVLLCGSGAAQAALCESPTDAERMANALRADGYWAEIAQLGL
jgi:4-diphosphocytidyl-2C-methyl-D-erythritol kinase